MGRIGTENNLEKGPRKANEDENSKRRLKEAKKGMRMAIWD